LFAAAIEDEQVFVGVLEKYFGGKRDESTVELMGRR